MSNRHLKDESRYRPLVSNGCFKYMLCHLLSKYNTSALTAIELLGSLRSYYGKAEDNVD